MTPLLALTSMTALMLTVQQTSTFRQVPTTATRTTLTAVQGAAPTETRLPVWVYFEELRAAPCEACDTAITELAVVRRWQRRTLPGVVDILDMPLPQECVNAVASTGATVRVQSRWLNAVSALATPAQIATLKKLPNVTRVEHVRRGRSAMRVENESVTTASQASFAAADAYGYAATQVDQIDVRRLHDAGYHGAGIVIGILDSGFRRVHQAFKSAEHPLQVIAEWDFVKNDNNTDIQSGDDSEQHKHGTWILGTMAAYLPNQLIGTAYEARFVLAKTEDVPTETPIEEDFYVAGLEFVEAHGADIATSSLGYIDWYTQNDMNGVTAVTTIAVNIATANGLICFTAAGNEGHDSNPTTNTLIAPADALQVISCGAVDNTGAIASFSSDGPTVDGRVKPELLAMGVSTATVNSTNTSGISGVSGTSLSTPLLAGAAACILQARPDFTVNSLRAALFATASRSDSNGLHPDPLFITGYGIAKAFAATQVPPPCPGDLNNSGSVDSSDIGSMLGEFGICAQCVGDLNYDGTVDASDLGTLLGHFGSCP
ncbi:hypothetical protein LBMAG50_02420 [Phycisphaerae bacterium]|nr:hypothetical protein LBMAG50_02420 [Phycisphaerae bacterium]